MQKENEILCLKEREASFCKNVLTFSLSLTIKDYSQFFFKQNFYNQALMGTRAKQTNKLKKFYHTCGNWLPHLNPSKLFF